MEEVLAHIEGHTVVPGDAVMFDIDDTLINSKTDKVIPHVKDLLDRCKQLGYKIVIITARSGDSYVQDLTEKQLAEHGIRYDFLGYCNAESKTYVKQHLMKTNSWHFVLSVGDLTTDLTDSDIYLLVQ